MIVGPIESFEEAEKTWISAEKCEFRVIPDSAKHTVSLHGLVNELTMLHRETGDERLLDAVDAVLESDLWDKSGWKGISPSRTLCDAEQIIVKSMAQYVALLIHLEGYSLRMACALTAAQTGFPANSFSAAVKAVERIWRQSDLRKKLDKGDVQMSNDNH